MSGYPSIKPGGVDDKYIIDLMYMLQASMKGLCAKLDDDAGVPLTTYEANCYTALFTVRVFDYRGNMTPNTTTIDHIVCPTGLTPAALIQWLWDWANAFETLTEQLDTDALSDSDYEDNCYEAILLPYQFENKKGTIIGQDASTGAFTGVDTGGPPWLLTKIGPTGKPNDRVLCDLFYDIINGWETMCEQLDDDGTVTDTDYESLWYEATVLMRVENSQGNMLGNAETRLG